MELFLQFFAAAGLGGLISAALQHFFGYRRSFLEWHLTERNNSIIEFLDAVAASDSKGISPEEWQKVLYAATKAKLFVVDKETQKAIDGFLLSPPKTEERTLALQVLWEKLGQEANRAPKKF